MTRWHWTGGAVLAAGAALALRAPRATAVAHFAGHRPANIAHAGAQGHAPQNTLPAFAQAVQWGVDAIELDLNLSADGHVVVIHDATVDRTTDGAGRVADMTLSELRELDAGHRYAGAAGDFPFRGKGVRIPTLDEVFEAVGDTFLVLEVKSDADPAIVDAVVDRIRHHGAEQRVLLASFSALRLRELRRRLPQVPTSAGEAEAGQLYGLHLVGLHRWWRCDARVVQVPECSGGRRIVSSRFVRAAHATGRHVHVWTVNEVADMHRLLDMGVDGLVTDYPDRLAHVIAQR